MRKMIILCASMVLFAGCIEYDEEMWLNKDLSGRLKMTLKVAEMAAPEGQGDPFQGLSERIRAVKGLKLAESRTFREDRKNCSTMVIEFDDVKTLSQLQDEQRKGGPFGSISVENLDNGTIKFQRVLTTGAEENPQAAAMAHAMFGQANWNYVAHFPCKIETANVSENRIDKKRNTVTWTYSLADLMTKSQTMQATLDPRRFPWGTVAAVVAGAALLLLTARLAQRRRAAPLPLLRDGATAKPVKSAPSPGEGARNRGMSSLVRAEFAEAVVEFTRAIELDPRYGAAYHSRGFARYRAGDYPEAKNDFDRAIDLDADYANEAGSFFYRGLTWEKLGDRQQAVQDMKVAANLGNHGAEAELSRMTRELSSL
jgi:tetratricopeptide (TPR) repeat protein